MFRDDEALLDIVRAADLILRFKQDVDEDSFYNDLKTQSAILHQLLIMVEAVKRLSRPFRQAHLKLIGNPLRVYEMSSLTLITPLTSNWFGKLPIRTCLISYNSFSHYCLEKKINTFAPCYPAPLLPASFPIIASATACVPVAAEPSGSSLMSPLCKRGFDRRSMAAAAAACLR